jgi:hypothetical protein
VKPNRNLGPAALALLVALACQRPPLLDPPTVVITDDTADPVAHGEVVFTFTFSKPIEAGFAANDIGLTGGTKGAFTRVSPTVATLEVLPLPGGPGTLTVEVPAGVAFDMAGLSNVDAVTFTHAYDLPPTVTITDDVTPPTLAHDEVLFTFTFDEPVGESFTIEDIDLTGGAKGTFTRVSPTVATLVAMPTRGESGTLTASVAAGAFADSSSQVSAAAASDAQGYDLTQQIRNGDFSQGTRLWDRYAQNGGDVSIAVNDEVLDVTVGALGPNVTDTQVKYMGGLNCVQGKHYRLTFDAWADAPRTLDTSIWENGHDLDQNGFPYSTYQYQTHSLTTQVTTFTSDVFMPFDITNPDASVVFFVGASTVPFHIDSVTFVELETHPTVQITDDAGAALAQGDDVTFTFTFSDPVGASFSIEDITVTGGTAGAFTMNGQTQATLVVKPIVAAAGALQISVAPGTFFDPHQSSNVQGASASEDYDWTSITQMVRNGDFSAGLTHWSTFGQNGAGLGVAADAGVLDVTVTSVGSSPSDAQVNYTGGINLTQGKNYLLSFDAWADAPRTLDASISENGHDTDHNGFAYSTYQYSQGLPLTTTPQTFTSEITHMPATNTDANVAFFVGASTIGVHIDNVTLTEVP